MRHMDDRKTVSQKRLFDEYSKKCEKLAKSSFQTILENNRAQGVIEQHFSNLGNIQPLHWKLQTIRNIWENYKSPIIFGNWNSFNQT